LEVEIGDHKTTINFVIIKTLDKLPPILGIRSIKDLGLITRNSIHEIKAVKTIIEQEKDLFQGTGRGRIKMNPCEFKLKANYQAVVIPCQRVPFQLLPKLEKELQRMVQDKVIVKITEPTEFVNPIVLVRKENETLKVLTKQYYENISKF